MGQDLLTRERYFNPLIAGVLSLCVPGLGQLYKGQLLRAVLWFLLTSTGYWVFFFPGLVLHFFSVLGAALGRAGRDRIQED
jgi:TM2 domain-containing membrane protein YozV